jgi:hypothetical protein
MPSKFLYNPSKTLKQKEMADVEDEIEQVEEEVEDEYEDEDEEQEEGEDEQEAYTVKPTSDPTVGRYRWLRAHLKDKPIPIRPKDPSLQHQKFLLTDVSKDIDKYKFSRNGVVYSNPTKPLREIFHAEGREAPKGLKAWDLCEGFVKSPLTDPTCKWVDLNVIIPLEFRIKSKEGSSEKLGKRTERAVSEKATKKSPAKKSKIPKSKPTKATKATKKTTKTTKATKSTKKTTKKATKKSPKKKVEVEPEEEDDVMEEEIEEESADEESVEDEVQPQPKYDLNIGVRKLGMDKVLSYEQQQQGVYVPDETHYQMLGLILNRAAVRNVLSFTTDETVELIKNGINPILKRRSESEIEVPQESLQAEEQTEEYHRDHHDRSVPLLEQINKSEPTVQESLQTEEGEQTEDQTDVAPQVENEEESSHIDQLQEYDDINTEQPEQSENNEEQYEIQQESDRNLQEEQVIESTEESPENDSV